MNRYRQEAILTIFLEVAIPAVIVGLIALGWQVINFLLNGWWQSTSIDWMIINYIPFEWYVSPKNWLGVNRILRGALSFHPMISMLFLNLFFVLLFSFIFLMFFKSMRKIKLFLKDWHW
jgi:hypothetical protein